MRRLPITLAFCAALTGCRGAPSILLNDTGQDIRVEISGAEGCNAHGGLPAGTDLAVECKLNEIRSLVYVRADGSTCQVDTADLVAQRWITRSSVWAGEPDMEQVRLSAVRCL